MEDYRISWMKERIYAALGLRDDKFFLELLSRDGEKASRELVSSLDSKREGYSQAILFYALEHEVEDMVEVVEGNFVNKLMGWVTIVAISYIEQEIEKLVEQAEQLEEVHQETSAGDSEPEPNGSNSANEAGEKKKSIVSRRL